MVLLEGRRQIPDEFAARAEALARGLATRFPKLRFRSGNATGSDAAFSSGVLSVDPQRLHVVAPYASHRKKYRHAEAQYDSPENLMVLEEEAPAYAPSGFKFHPSSLKWPRRPHGRRHRPHHPRLRDGSRPLRLPGFLGNVVASLAGHRPCERQFFSFSVAGYRSTQRLVLCPTPENTKPSILLRAKLRRTVVL